MFVFSDFSGATPVEKILGLLLIVGGMLMVGADHRRLLRPGITQLDEECAVRLSDVKARLAEIII